jgi:molybdenum cofactor synthesis domain-containing protein
VKTHPPGKKVAVVAVGNEILAGDVEENNATFLTRELNRLGSTVGKVIVLPDEEDVIAGEITGLSLEYDAVLVTGGIGLTHDDVTRQAVARAVNKPLEVNGEIYAVIKNSHRDGLNPLRKKLASFPRSSRLIHNPLTAAPGFIVDNIYVFPGVPEMLKEMFPEVAGEFTGPPIHRQAILTAHPESKMARPLEEINGDSPGVEIGSYPVSREGKHRVRLVLKSRDRKKLLQAARKVKKMLALLDPG